MEIVQKTYKILVIEDNLGDFALVELYLQEHFPNLILHHTRSFKQTKELLATEAISFDVVLLDLSLPDKMGFKLINAILEFSLNIPILVLTGHSDMAFGIKSLAMGVSDYILKEELTSTLLYKSIIYSLERKKATCALQESEQQYSELFHFSPQPMWVFDHEHYRFLDANNAAVRQYGYSKCEFLAMTDEEIINKINIYGICDITETNKYQSAGICIHQKKNNEFIKVDVHRNPIEYKGKDALIISANDVSERLNYIKAIEVQNEKLKEISWIQSHKVRAPVARILGLITLINTEKGNYEEMDQIIHFLSVSANELDDAIKDINKKIYCKEFQI